MGDGVVEIGYRGSACDPDEMLCYQTFMVEPDVAANGATQRLADLVAACNGAPSEVGGKVDGEGAAALGAAIDSLTYLDGWVDRVGQGFRRVDAVGPPSAAAAVSRRSRRARGRSRTPAVRRRRPRPCAGSTGPTPASRPTARPRARSARPRTRAVTADPVAEEQPDALGAGGDVVGDRRAGGVERDAEGRGLVPGEGHGAGPVDDRGAALQSVVPRHGEGLADAGDASRSATHGACRHTAREGLATTLGGTCRSVGHRACAPRHERFEAAETVIGR